ncbi:MAG: hypothetical protein SWE60_23285, partial [Thermodesulfobacteriota bacterium]|nr:hypothetical protein [Thermodesulfobacteriota bacterium]
MKTPQSKFKYRAATIFIIAAALIGLLHFGGLAVAGPYADSGHGDTTYGVNRSGTGYDTGDCAHCHDTYDPDICGNDTYGLMLFAANDNPTPTPQSDNFCYECHGNGTAQAVTNHTYSRNFGGGTATFATIYDAFNPATGATPSSHNLADVLNHAVGRDIGFTSDMNPCLVCHDHHTSQKNYPVTSSGLGGVKTAVRRPTDYATPPTNLWGDESGTNELMSEYTNKYQAPYYVGDITYEPANDSTTSGSNLPNFFNFCMNQCHTASGVLSTEHGSLTEIDWSTTGDFHGRDNNPSDGYGYTVAPYTAGEDHNYVLSCTDCHEPHGSENEWLLRTCVNGIDNISIPE